MSSNNKPYRRRVRLDADEAPTDRTQTHRRKKAAISLNSFSSKKGHDRALQEYKKRKETKFQKNATLLREYQRVMKQEGFEVGKGASRWRDEEGRKGSKKRTNTTDEDEIDDYADETYEQRKARTKRLKSDPLLKARKLAEQRKAEKEELFAQKETKTKSEGKKQHDRKTRAKKLMKRTRKGQPVMKNVIGDLLGRIKSEVGET
uniref:rRNA-processing protein FYV7 n=1 Tax=Skeletonema marinoi TaxID=267567 RepID=A0A6U3XUC2_9STRA